MLRLSDWLGLLLVSAHGPIKSQPTPLAGAEALRWYFGYH